MPLETPSQLRVAECGDCQQLFAVYAMEGVVACPHCAKPVEIVGLETAPLGIAEPVEVRVETPSPAVEPAAVATAEPTSEPAPVVAASDTVEAVGSEPSDSTLAEFKPAEVAPAEPEGPPTVAEWLMRQEEPTRKPTNAKPTLSESLGWNEGLPGFEPPPSEPVEEEPARVEAAPAVESAPVDAVTPPTDEFRFDFGATPLHETATEEEVDATESLATEPPGPVGSSHEPAELSWAAVNDSNDAHEVRRGWFAPMASLAGLAVIGATAGVWLLGAEEPGEAVAWANRGDRLSAPPYEGEPTPPDPFPATDPIATSPLPGAVVPPPDPSGDAPIVDPAAQPATYDAPGLPEPSPLPEEDAFATLPPATPPPTSRYADADPVSFDELPPASEFKGLGVRVPEPVSSVSTVELIGVTPVTLEELESAVATSDASGRAFAGGDLSDPGQVPALGQHYAQLSYLAQVISLLDPAEKSTRRSTSEMEAVDIFTKLFREERPRVQSRQIAGQWIGWSGRPYGGVFFAGLPVEIVPMGSGIRYEFELGSERIPVVMSEVIDVNRYLRTEAKEIGIVGVVVEEPQKWIAGYEGDDERVVWARKTIPLRAPSEL